MTLGDVVVAWLLQRSAEVALAALAGDAGSDRAFYEGKVAAAQFFAAEVLPKISAELAIAQAPTWRSWILTRQPSDGPICYRRRVGSSRDEPTRLISTPDEPGRRYW